MCNLILVGKIFWVLIEKGNREYKFIYKFGSSAKRYISWHAKMKVHHLHCRLRPHPVPLLDSFVHFR